MIGSLGGMGLRRSGLYEKGKGEEEKKMKKMK